MRLRIRTLVAAVAAVVLLTAVTVSAVLAHGGFGRGGGKSGAATAIEEQTGLSTEEIRTRLQGGESLADIIEAEGGDLEAVVTAALTGLDDKVDALVEAGRLESDQVDDYKAAAEQRVRDWLAGTYEGKRGKGRGRFGGKGVGLVGIVSERDIVRGLAERGAEFLGCTVEDCMASPVETCAPGDGDREILALMTDRRFRHLPVLEDGRLIGIVSIGDVVKARIDGVIAEADALRDYIVRG